MHTPHLRCSTHWAARAWPEIRSEWADKNQFVDASGRDENFFYIDGNKPLRELREWG